MSRIGSKPIPVPTGVTVSIEPEVVRVNGPRGELVRAHPPRHHRRAGGRARSSSRARPTAASTARCTGSTARSWPTWSRASPTGYAKTLEIQGVGYRAALKGKDLELALGYSHPVPIKAPDGIEFEVPQPTRVIVKGISKQLVGEIAANIRKQRPPEPYKGKGIRYEGEYVARKVGKRA